ncbi:hypothetical protein F1559_004397 [Cyanidiococcus yangmingshanensis]|uniref:TATA element modulatory factor 1 TATA binding domain-containing protein n=1 Tax=Cyanidiococcus yangmingshanensis TaxID=2690220 RepID=A0A7J7IPB3_9RHOD|nr:hypothetical protein F1559_004397 [Cyanidiococcus yangmingshanensis]
MDKLRVLQAQLHHMRDVIERTRNDAEQRELYLREELVQARNRIAELEQQNQELSGGVSEATRPLLRQIQLLQVQIRERRETEVSTREQIERQLVQAEAAVAEANEARARLAEEITRLRARVHELESATHSFISECEGLRKEKAAAEEALSEFRARCAQLEDVATKASAEWTRKLTALETDADRKQKAFECTLEGLQRERDEARQQLEQRERELSRIGDLLGASASATASVSPAPIQSPANECANTVEAREELMSSGAAANEPAMAHEESLLTSPFPNPILWTQMQSLLRRRANQMRTLQAELTEREASIANLTQEISMLTERLDADAVHRRQLEERIGQMEEREQALLELLGEREERLQELNNDIADMKAIYREQLQELVDQLEEARTATQTSTLSRP